jgi:hypothetical protein
MRKKGIIRHGRGIIENQNASLLARDKKPSRDTEYRFHCVVASVKYGNSKMAAPKRIYALTVGRDQG